ncbi:MAG TPA: glycosyltransferase family 9 protein [Bryobacteraceae bacterium]
MSRRLLAIRPGGVGDCILCFPAIESLRNRCEYLEVWTPRAVTPLVYFADRVRAISDTGLDLFGLEGLAPNARLIETLRNFDAIVSWYGTNRADFRSAAEALSLPIEFHIALPPQDSQVHACDFFCAQLGAPPGATPRIPTISQKRHFFAIHPFSGSPRKNWPLDRFDAVARAVGIPVEWCTTSEQATELGSRTPLLAVDDLAQVAYWLSEALVYLGNDSGITHLAAAVGTPVIALFGGASDPKIWAPRGDSVRIITGASMDAIGVDAVVA